MQRDAIESMSTALESTHDSDDDIEDPGEDDDGEDEDGDPDDPPLAARV